MSVNKMPELDATTLLEGLKAPNFFKGKQNLPVCGISCDSRQVIPGDLFIAVKGEEHDGHQYITEALERKAAAIVAEHPPAGTPPVNWIQVPDTRLALARIAATFYHHPACELFVVGVTGTCGKTTTTSMLQEIYKTAGFNTGLIGTVHVNCNGEHWPARLTTPDALEVQRLLRLMVDSKINHAVMEVSSHGLAQKRVDSIKFNGAIFTNISPNHLDFHQTLGAYAAAKWRLASLVAAGGFVLANGDDPYFGKMAAPPTATHLFWGSQQSCHFRIHNIVLGKGGSFFGLNVKKDVLMQHCSDLEKNDFFFHIPLPGKHNVYNAAAAIAAALLSGVNDGQIRQALKSFKGVERRLQFYQCGDLQVMDDTAMSPGSIDAVFRTLQELAFNGEDLIIVYAIRGHRGTEVNEDNGRTLARWVKKMRVRCFFSTSSINHVDEQNEVLPEEKEAFDRGVWEGGAAVRHYDELEEALAEAVNAAIPEVSTILLLGAQGMDEGLLMLQKQYAPGKGLVPSAHRE